MSRYDEKVELMEYYKAEIDKLDLLKSMANYINNLIPFDDNKINNLLHCIADFINDYYFSISPKKPKEELKKILRENLTESWIPLDEKYKVLLEIENKFLEVYFKTLKHTSNKVLNKTLRESFIDVFEEKCDLVTLALYANKTRRFTNIA